MYRNVIYLSLQSETKEIEISISRTTPVLDQAIKECVCDVCLTVGWIKLEIVLYTLFELSHPTRR